MAGPVAAQEFLGKNVFAWSKELERPEESCCGANAAYALGKLGRQGSSAVPALTKHLKEDTSPKVREAAAFALGEVGKENGLSPGAELISPLVQALKDENYLVRRSAAFALGSLGIEAGGAKDALAAALQDPRPEVRQNVA